ncbi:MAG: hypothetical protein KIT25_19875 [Enhydrobacter sp.]|nr:MAG: hypothetical protein KIT25_19875 [Enhydrobacter sp.]
MASLFVLLSASAAVAQDVDRGRLLAQRWCAACHVVDRAAARGAADGLPTFPAIAADPSTTDGRLRGFMTAAHGRMPDFSLGAGEQNDLIAYILSLRPR